MAELVIRRLRGMNNTDAPSALPDDQCANARNVEYDQSMLGERRRGAAQIDLTGSELEDCVQCTWLHRHLPASADADAELYAFGWKLDATKVWQYKDTAWHDVTFGDGASQLAGITFYAYQIAGQSLHRKLFVAYKSAKDRLHVIEDGVMRLTGLAEPEAPTAADAGSGSFAGTRYYRVRYVVLDGSTVLRRSEPSEVLTFAPSGTGASVTVTKPAAITEGETHWELEASTDNANFYRIARTVVATTTVSDSTAYATGYAAGGVLSEEIGAYTTAWSARYVVADEDRLVFLGSFEDDDYASRVGWTPKGNAPGVGNDERVDMTVDSTLDLDGLDGGPITGAVGGIHGFIYVFKRSAIFKLVRTGVRHDAYEAFCMTKSHGAVPGSVVQATDESGNPVVYFLDPSVGPCVLGANGLALQPCGNDIRTTWAGFNVDAVDKAATGVYYPAKRQVHWWICTGASDRTTTRIVLHTELMRNGRYGWAVWTGASCSNVFSACMYAENIDDGDDRSHVLKPLLARDTGGDTSQGVIWQTDVGDDDNGAEFESLILTKPYTPASILNQFGVRNAAVMGKATEGATLEITFIRDYDARRTAVTVDFSPEGSEDHVIKRLDHLEMKELRALQVEFKDPASPGARWELNEFVLALTGGQRS